MENIEYPSREFMDGFKARIKAIQADMEEKHELFEKATYLGWNPESTRKAIQGPDWRTKDLTETQHQLVSSICVIYLQIGGGWSNKKLSKRNAEIRKFLNDNKINQNVGERGPEALTISRIVASYPHYLIAARVQFANKCQFARSYEVEVTREKELALYDPALIGLTRTINNALAHQIYMQHAHKVAGIDNPSYESKMKAAEKVYAIIPMYGPHIMEEAIGACIYFKISSFGEKPFRFKPQTADD